jgi:hypothetical protein
MSPPSGKAEAEHGSDSRGDSRALTSSLATDNALRRSEERLRLVQEATGFAEFEASVEGISHFSERFLEQVGLPAGTTLLSHDEWLK